MSCIDYTYYTETYGGKLVKNEDFIRLSSKATAYVNMIAQGRIGSNVTDPIKMAICAVMDEMYNQEKGLEIASESSGKESRSYVASGKSNNQKLYEEAKPWLVNTGLLYRGLT
ncbi:MAG: hypothetical protein ABGU93_07080 [Acetobacterium sp.]|uniref:hypothetical protein n=1 Tax=Acetobacterium sp. TaxID=1872094 RepID=UPI003241F55A